MLIANENGYTGFQQDTCIKAAAETWRRVWGDVFTPKISDDLFLFWHRPGFSDFPVLTVIKCPIRPFLHRKNHYFIKEFLNKTMFFTPFILSHTSDNTTSLNIGGTNAWAVPHLNFFGGRPPPPPPGPPPRSWAPNPFDVSTQ